MVSSIGPMAPQGSSFEDRSSITEVILPSRGLTYSDGKDGRLFPTGGIRISAMTVAEEKMMTLKNGDPARKIGNLIAKTCDLRGMKPEQLLLTDQHFLLLKVRALSYGSNYSFKFRCEECRHQWTHTLNLETDIPITYAEDGWQEPFSLELPVSGVEVTFRLPRSIDEIELNKRKIKDGENDPTFVSMLARCLLTFDGESFGNQRTAEAWLEKQSVRDRGALTKALDDATPGYAAGEVVVECPACGYSHETQLPMTAEFFRPDVSA